MLRAAERVLRGLWAGCLCTVGYLVAPVLFAVLDDRAEAGRLAGEMFTWASLASVAMAVLLGVVWAALGRMDRRRLLLAAGVLGLVACIEWGLRPLMEAARLADGTPGEGFAALHGISSVLWLGASALALWLAGLGDLPAREA